ncbi:hypothetical protein JD969_09575 [Planctomycetota bacterium]|nr:hypothetical protein JD969_09575 [Planctomycetota bacterium]
MSEEVKKDWRKEIERYELPLNREDFKEALLQGLGRAKLHVEQYGVEGVEDLLVGQPIWGCMGRG